MTRYQRGRRTTPNDMADNAYTSWCPAHGKQIFDTRKRGRAAANTRGGGMRPYRCDAVHGGWHIGHKPTAVKAGIKTASEYYGRQRSA